MKQKIFVILLIILGLTVFVIYGMRTYHSFARLRSVGLHPRATRDVEMIQGWMTPHYISRVYAVPEQDLFTALNIPFFGNQFRSLDELNRVYYPARPGSVLQRVIATVAAYQGHQTPPPPLPTPISTPTPTTTP